MHPTSKKGGHCDITAHTILLYVLLCLTHMYRTYCTLYILYITCSWSSRCSWVSHFNLTHTSLSVHSHLEHIQVFIHTSDSHSLILKLSSPSAWSEPHYLLLELPSVSQVILSGIHESAEARLPMVDCSANGMGA